MKTHTEEELGKIRAFCRDLAELLRRHDANFWGGDETSVMIGDRVHFDIFSDGGCRLCVVFKTTEIFDPPGEATKGE